MKSLVLFFKGQVEAMEAAQTVIALDPNAAYGYFAMSQAEYALGRCEQSIAHIKQAFALSPHDPLGSLWHLVLGGDEACLGRLDPAIAEFKGAIDAGYRTFFAYAFLAGAQAAKGNEAEAKLALAEARRINPQLTMRSLSFPGRPAPVISEDLRKAGLPEG